MDVVLRRAILKVVGYFLCCCFTSGFIFLNVCWFILSDFSRFQTESVSRNGGEKKLVIFF